MWSEVKSMLTSSQVQSDILHSLAESFIVRLEFFRCRFATATAARIKFLFFLGFVLFLCILFLFVAFHLRFALVVLARGIDSYLQIVLVGSSKSRPDDQCALGDNASIPDVLRAKTSDILVLQRARRAKFLLYMCPQRILNRKELLAAKGVFLIWVETEELAKRAARMRPTICSVSSTLTEGWITLAFGLVRTNLSLSKNEMDVQAAQHGTASIPHLIFWYTLTYSAVVIELMI